MESLCCRLEKFKNIVENMYNMIGLLIVFILERFYRFNINIYYLRMGLV